jgi:hypothetical protein
MKQAWLRSPDPWSQAPVILPQNYKLRGLNDSKEDPRS